MLSRILSELHYRLFADWDHRLTGFIGGTATLTLSTLDALSKILGLVAVLVAVYCSIARDLRERRAEKRALDAMHVKQEQLLKNVVVSFKGPAPL